jgi:hypothetical protein
MSALEKILSLFPNPIGPSSGELLDQAEDIGTVELSDWCGTKRACITVGKYGEARIQIWGNGATTRQALREAIDKARLMLNQLGSV